MCTYMRFLNKFCTAKMFHLTWFPFRTRAYTHICFYVSLVSLLLQLMAYVVIMYTLDENTKSFRKDHNQCSTQAFHDFKSLMSMGSDMDLSFILLEKQFLNIKGQFKNNTPVLSFDCSFRPILLALEEGSKPERLRLFIAKVVENDFVPVTFFNAEPSKSVQALSNIKIAILLQRTVTFQIMLLYGMEDNSWWFGDLYSDPAYKMKLYALNQTIDNFAVQTAEGLIDRFEVIPSAIDERLCVLYPKNVTSVLKDIHQSKFIECNATRATQFRSRFGYDRSVEAVRFRHKVWKVLSRVKIVLENLGIEFWLSSGTALGYYRECDIIAHSKDVDIGVWASSYTDKIVTEMRAHEFELKISLGFPNDSLEYSFIDNSGIKLDMFFFYKEDSHYWNGGTQVKSGKKFKYIFPKFTLCWTLFKSLKVRVPCEIEAYIKANYGPDWFTPVKYWDWKSSPFNVHPNGLWSDEQLSDAIKLYT